MENVAVVVFNVESEGYQAFTELQQASIANDYTVYQFALVKREGDRIVPCNMGDSGANTADDTMAGLLIGSIVGILGGPLGVLLGGTWGAAIGSTMDLSDAANDESMLEVVAEKIYDNDIALIALVQEEDTAAFDALFEKFDCVIARYDAADIAVQVEEAREAEKALRHQAKAALKAQKKADRKERREEHRAAIKASFDKKKAVE